MQTILGPFNPDLEDSLVEEILKYKDADLLSPLLILTPSDLLRRRLKILLSRERRLALLNVQLLTFYQLALRLQAESSGTSVGAAHRSISRRGAASNHPLAPARRRSPLPASKSAPAAAPRSGRPCAICATDSSIQRSRSTRWAKGTSASAPANAHRSFWSYCEPFNNFAADRKSPTSPT